MQRFRGLCSPCKKRIRLARKAAEESGLDPARVAPGRDPDSLPKPPSGRLKRRARVKARSDKEALRQAALKGIKAILGPFVKHCLRCNQPNRAGTGFKSKANPLGLEAHHPFRRRGYFYFVVVPLCETCHEEVEQDGNQARADRWIVKDPVKK
jgi:hypothetical protein